MIIQPPSQPNKCIYCDTVTKKGKKGEHIFPKVIGCALTLNDVSGRVVCQKCNNGVLAEVDRELCSRSYLSIVASQELGTHLWQVWNVDHAAANLLVEAEPTWIDGMLAGLRCYPQVTIEQDGKVHVRGDPAEMQSFGRENFQRVLIKAVKRAFHRYCANEKRVFHLERVESFMMEGGVRLAPRFFSRDKITEIAAKIDKQSFTLRFANDHDRRLALRTIESFDENQPFKRWRHAPGSAVPRISFVFNVGGTLRGLMKIGVNLVAAYCKNTPVNPTTFGTAIQLIQGNIQITSMMLGSNGFVSADDIASIKPDGKNHSFRLVHLAGMWFVFSSFFGGRIGARRSFSRPQQ